MIISLTPVPRLQKKIVDPVNAVAMTAYPEIKLRHEYENCNTHDIPDPLHRHSEK